ncbi:MAG: hypothetical protein M3167_06160 [Acidobacteriota bacterium]|nr:hypothetical protein [Acidobacteriota bacterium]MDQ6892248.1 hypothetical protein [Acidobacteriota bacterium]
MRKTFFVCATAIAVFLTVISVQCSTTAPRTPSPTPAPVTKRGALGASSASTAAAVVTPSSSSSCTSTSHLLEVEYAGGSIVSYQTNDGTIPSESFNVVGTAPVPPPIAKRFYSCQGGQWTLDAPQPNPTVGPSSQCPLDARQVQYLYGWPGVGPGQIPTPNAAGDVAPSSVQKVIFGCGTTLERMTVALPPGTPALLLPWPDPFIPDAAGTPGTPTPSSTPTVTAAPPTPQPTPVVVLLGTEPISFEVDADGLGPQAWAALYRASDPDLAYSACASCWQYLTGSQTPPAAAASGTVTLSFAIPPPGTYNIRIFPANGVANKLTETGPFVVVNVAATPSSTPTPTRTPTPTATPATPAIVLSGVPSAITFAFRIPVAGDYRIFAHGRGPGIVEFSIDGAATDAVNLAPSAAARWIPLSSYLRGTGPTVHFSAGVHTIALDFPGDASVDQVVVTQAQVYP